MVSRGNLVTGRPDGAAQEMGKWNFLYRFRNTEEIYTHEQQAEMFQNAVDEKIPFVGLINQWPCFGTQFPLPKTQFPLFLDQSDFWSWKFRHSDTPNLYTPSFGIANDIHSN